MNAPKLEAYNLSKRINKQDNEMIFKMMVDQLTKAAQIFPKCYEA